MFGSLGIQEILIIGVVFALLFGPRQLPKLGRALGDTVRELRGSAREIQKSFDETEAEVRAAPRKDDSV